MSKRVIVTCGPSYEPIDEVRRITNISTGELGMRLAGELAASGFEVTCFRGEVATTAQMADGAQIISFSTNDDLLSKLEAAAQANHCQAIFHVAALADFRVIRRGAEKKIASRAGELTLTLVPATKVLSQLRGLFPKARIVGWKYELDDSREDAIAMGRAQIAENGTDACVVNGTAYGDGFGFLPANGEAVTHCADKAALCQWLAEWLKSS